MRGKRLPQTLRIPTTRRAAGRSSASGVVRATGEASPALGPQMRPLHLEDEDAMAAKMRCDRAAHAVRSSETLALAPRQRLSNGLFCGQGTDCCLFLTMVECAPCSIFCLEK